MREAVTIFVFFKKISLLMIIYKYEYYCYFVSRKQSKREECAVW
jgi:hypothetical protein